MAKGSALLRGDVGFAAQSDWSRHSLNAQANATYFRFTSLPDASRPDASANAALKIDILRDTFANFELRGALTTQRSGSPDVPGATINQPLVGSFGFDVRPHAKLRPHGSQLRPARRPQVLWRRANSTAAESRACRPTITPPTACAAGSPMNSRQA